MRIGIDSFVAAVPDALTGENLGPADRLRLLLDEIEFADRVGLDVFGVGEHHRAEFLDSAPETILAAAAVRTERMAPRFAIVPYTIARRSAAAYYPETNVLVPIRSVAAKSNQPVFKCIRITLTPSESCEPLHFSEKDVAHNLNRVVPRLS